MPHTLAVIAGDGIGPEVVGEALKVLDAVEAQHHPGVVVETAPVGSGALPANRHHDSARGDAATRPRRERDPGWRARRLPRARQRARARHSPRDALPARPLRERAPRAAVRRPPDAAQGKNRSRLRSRRLPREHGGTLRERRRRVQGRHAGRDHDRRGAEHAEGSRADHSPRLRVGARARKDSSDDGRQGERDRRRMGSGAACSRRSAPSTRTSSATRATSTRWRWTSSARPRRSR